MKRMPVMSHLLVITATLLSGCTSGMSGDDSGVVPNSISVIGEILFSGEELKLPGRMIVLGEHLVVGDDLADSLVHVIGTDGRYVRGYGRRGEGPGEFRSASHIDYAPGADTRFWVFDVPLQRLTLLDLLANGQPSSSLETITLRGDGPATGPLWLDHEHIISPGFFSSPGRFATFDRTGRIVDAFGSLPAADRRIPTQVLQHAYQSSVRLDPTRSQLVVATRHADRLEIYGTDGILIASAIRPHDFEPRYQVASRAGRPAMTSGDDLRFGYIDIATTDQFIYGLYSGRSRSEVPRAANLGDEIRIFDWQANFIRSLQLDARAFSIAVSVDDSRLYATRHDPSPAILTYVIPSPASSVELPVERSSAQLWRAD